jgi:glucosamine 6-phosphate synthetase-like amidotransferase/phosphosugar isomerase protein
MCGITAYAGKESALPFLLQGLEKLEYRGYDSAGVTLVSNHHLETYKAKGRLTNLKELLNEKEHPEHTGIGHTRWATHGVPSNMNSHPHTNESETISIVHNGIIENYASIKECLLEQGYTFQSQTDSEVIVHMLDYYYQGDMMYALKKCVQYLQGSFALCVVCTDYPDCVFVAKKESPMILGKTDTSAFCASEFRYGNYRIDENTLCIFVSQSGETADTLAALKLSKENKAQTLSVTNVLGSSLARLSDYVLYTCAGPEIAVASTKAYTTQLVLLACLCLKLASLFNKGVACKNHMINQLKQMPDVVEQMLAQEEKMAEFAKLLTNQKDAYFIGRQLDYLSVLEGALKLKEVSYVHADAYMAGELKHGPIALIEKDTVVIALATQPSVAQKTISNILETVARGAKVILIASQSQNTEGFEYVIRIPDVDPLLSCIPATVLLQELAYYVAKEKGCDVDKPRNLAKSVTVE